MLEKMRKRKTDPVEVALRLSGQMRTLKDKDFTDRYGIMPFGLPVAEITVPIPKGWEVRLDWMYEYGPNRSQTKAGSFAILLVKENEDDT